MTRRLRVGRVLAALLLPPLCAILASGRTRAEPEPYETPPVLAADAVLPADLRRGAHHRVQEAVSTRYGLHGFRVTSPYGTYDVLSQRLLEIRVREIETMASVVGMDGAPEFFRSLGSSLAGLPTAAVTLVTHPGRSFAQVRRGLGKTWSRIGDAFRHRRRTAYEDGSAANVFCGDEKRRLAAELGLDVYSTNPQIRRFLNDVAGARAGGNLTVDLASFALPVVGYVAVTTAKWHSDVRRLLRDRTPLELDRHNAGVLADIGIARETWRAFLGHVWLSPRHRTVITATARSMHGVGGLGSVLEAATTARSEVGALMQEQQAVLLSHHHTDVEALTGLVRVRHLVVARTRSGSCLAFVPLDVLAWDAATASLVDALRPAMQVDGARRLHVTGRVTDRARRELERQGFEVVAEHRPDDESRPPGSS